MDIVYKNIGFGFKKIWYQKKFRILYQKSFKFGLGKSFGFGFVTFVQILCDADVQMSK